MLTWINRRYGLAVTSLTGAAVGISSPCSSASAAGGRKPGSRGYFPIWRPACGRPRPSKQFSPWSAEAAAVCRPPCGHVQIRSPVRVPAKFAGEV